MAEGDEIGNWFLGNEEVHDVIKIIPLKNYY